MLVLSRRKHESINIGPEITVTVIRIKGGEVRLGIEAPNWMRITRSVEMTDVSVPGNCLVDVDGKGG